MRFLELGNILGRDQGSGMKNRRPIVYRVHAGPDLDGDRGWTFRSFRRAANYLARLDDECATLVRVACKGSFVQAEPQSERVLACWMINESGEIGRFSRRWISLARKEAKQEARRKRMKLTVNGLPYSGPPDRGAELDIPF
jgi:hypothetical protein